MEDYQTELVERLAQGYIHTYEFGFKNNSKRIVSWTYEVTTSGDLVGGSDDGAGGVYARADVLGADYYNHTTSTAAWSQLTSSQQESFEDTLPFKRTHGYLPDDGEGHWVADHTYSRGSVTVGRKTFRPW